ncbi:AAA family ATPase [Profundibacter sp.]|uniref:AAA family ATPase n=1 Tax=Profundibacter sp. TaxID=3101071 RepID=UPI003D0EB15E
MIERGKYHEVTELLDSFPAVAIIGPRQVGKTTLAHEIAETRPSVYLDVNRRAKLTHLGGL